MLVGVAIAVALSVLFEWPNTTLGWSIIGVIAVVEVAWGFLRPPRRRTH
jgi:hypothetical protein